MALPKRRHSTRSGGKRFATKKKSLPPTIKCRHCGGDKLPHRVCPHCGRL